MLGVSYDYSNYHVTTVINIVVSLVVTIMIIDHCWVHDYSRSLIIKSYGFGDGTQSTFETINCIVASIYSMHSSDTTFSNASCRKTYQRIPEEDRNKV